MKKLFTILFASGLLLSHASLLSANTPSNIGPTIGNIQEAQSAERGFIGDIIATIFDASGRIQNNFVIAFQTIEGNFQNTLPRWDGMKFVQGTITDNGSQVGIGIEPHTSDRVSINGNMRVGDIFSQSNDSVKVIGGGESQSQGASISLFGQNQSSFPNYLALRTNNLNRLVIQNNGNVGIGTTAPTERLQVQGNILASGDITTRVLNTNWGANIGRGLNVGYGLDVNYGATIGYGLDVGHALNVNYGATIGYGLDVGYGANIARDVTIGRSLTVDTDTFYVNNVSNRVGVGTTVPTQRLDVNGKIRMRQQTQVGDSNDIVATKGYVDSRTASNNILDCEICMGWRSGRGSTPTNSSCRKINEGWARANFNDRDGGGDGLFVRMNCPF